MATDPVCGMFVEEGPDALRLARGSRTVYFCSRRCLAEFAEPERELRTLRRRLAVAWPFSLTIAALTYLTPFPEWPWVALGLATIVQVYPARPFYEGTVDAIRNRIWNMDILIAVGTTLAFAESVVVVVLPGSVGGSLYFDASSLIVTLILTGNYLEHLTREHARGALRRLREELPATARVVEGDVERDVPIGDVRPGSSVRVRPGERIPCDGVVLDGVSSAVEALLTGESLPVRKIAGSAVVAGSVNLEGALTVRATRVGEDTTLAQIAQLLAEAEASHVPLQQLADRIAARFVPAVLVLAVLAAVAWTTVGAPLSVALVVFVAVVITACPCAFGIATPAAIVVGTGRAAEFGVLFKGSDALERASTIDRVVVDKTGTLTRGTPAVVAVTEAAGTTADQVRALASGVERGSEHPLARAVVADAVAHGVRPAAVANVQVEPGAGARGGLYGRQVAVLSGASAEAAGVDLGSLRGAIDRADRAAHSWSVVVEDGRATGLVEFADPVAPGAAAAIATLERAGVPVEMVTGDREPTAAAVARATGIRKFIAQATPGAKVDRIRALQRDGHRVAFVGDGLNDAPALAAADLGIAIGSGTEVAREAGGVVLTRDDLGGVAFALQVGRRTVGKVRSNLAWAVGYNAVLLPIAAGALVPWTGPGLFAVLPIAGALAMALSSTTVVLNSLTLRWLAPDPGTPSRATPVSVPSKE